MSRNIKGALLSLAGFGVYASHDVVIKFLGADYSALQIIFISGLLGFPLVSLMLLSDRTDGNLIARRPGWSILRALSAVATGMAGFYAFSVLPMATCYAIFFAMPLLITLLAIPLLGEKVGLRRGAAVLIGLLGVLVVLRPGSEPLTTGHLAALFAAFAGALTSVIVRKIGAEERSAVLLLYPMIASVVVAGAAMPFVYLPMPVEHLGLMAVIAALGLVASLLIIAAYRAAPAVIVAPMQYSQILWAAVYGALFFGESVDLWTGVGAAIIIASGIFILWREGTPSVSRNAPVLSNRSRAETGLMPRIGLLLWRREVGAGDR
jgi:S-adenosylmethionine uptake transporter